MSDGPVIHGLGGPAGAGYGHPVDPDRVDTSHGPILYLDDITVSFDGFKALNKLSLVIDRGELRCIIGPNGAGKTTMMDVITGKTRPDEGTAFFGQTFDLTRLPETEIARLGIGRKFQKPTVFEKPHGVREPGTGDEDRQAGEADAAGPPERRAARSDRPHPENHPPRRGRGRASPARCRTGRSSGWRSACCWCRSPELILLDEPVAGMTDAETAHTAELILELEGTHSIVVVEHDMDFVGQIARKVTVLHEGSVLAEGGMQQVQANERVIEVYLGR